jgi:hypothetical protein
MSQLALVKENAVVSKETGFCEFLLHIVSFAQCMYDVQAAHLKLTPRICPLSMILCASILGTVITNLFTNSTTLEGK